MQIGETEVYRVLCRNQFSRWFSAIVLGLTLFATAACRTTDQGARICEEDNRQCNFSCAGSTPEGQNPNLSYQNSGYQVSSVCEQGCERTYQACLKRRNDRAVKVINNENVTPAR